MRQNLKNAVHYNYDEVNVTVYVSGLLCGL